MKLSKITNIVKNGNVFFLSAFIYIFVLVSALSVYFVVVRRVSDYDTIKEQLLATELIKLKLMSTVGKDIDLVLHGSYSPTIIKYFADPHNKDLEAEALERISSYQRLLSRQKIFWINDVDKIFHSSDADPYPLDPSDPANSWYNITLYETNDYNFIINYDERLDLTTLFINVPVYDQNGRSIGVLGIEEDFKNFIDYISDVHNVAESNITLIMFNELGEVTFAPDSNAIVNKVSLSDYLGEPGEKIMQSPAHLKNSPDSYLDYENNKYFVSYVPFMYWHMLLISPTPPVLSDDALLNFFFFGLLVLIGIVLTIISLYVQRQRRMLLIATRSAESANHAKSNFLATMSHEIRTPLSAIIGISEIELSQNTVSNQIFDSLDRIHASAYGLLGIINDILDLSRIETGRSIVSPSDYDVANLINDTVKLNITRIASKPIEFLLEVSPDLPSKLHGDELRVKQILNNILSNAFKYTERGHVKMSVSFEPYPEPDLCLIFKISDTGQGIKPEDIGHIFDEYARFNTEANSNVEGVGLGMPITKKLVEMMNGVIEVDSVYGSGSTFTIKLLQQSASDKPLGKNTAKRLEDFKFSRRKHTRIDREYMPYGKVLVVDDMDNNLFVTSGLLKPYGLTVETTESGISAIKKVRDGSVYDIIFMDHMMPEMDGVEASAAIRNMGYTAPIIALTANAISGNAKMFLENGFDDFISKPIDILQLNAALNTFIRDKQPPEVLEKARSMKKPEISEALISGEHLMRIFRKDAKRALETLILTSENLDFKLFSITAHAMKGSLANLGEHDACTMALKLENAGNNGDLEYIKEHLEAFLEAVNKLIYTEEVLVDDDEVLEDYNLLKEQMEIIRKACHSYDEVSARQAIRALEASTWKASTLELIDEISGLIRRSEFEDAAEKSGEF